MITTNFARAPWRASKRRTRLAGVVRRGPDAEIVLTRGAGPAREMAYLWLDAAELRQLADEIQRLLQAPGGGS